jgi:hypothetical protein
MCSVGLDETSFPEGILIVPVFYIERVNAGRSDPRKLMKERWQHVPYLFACIPGSLYKHFSRA